MIYSNNGIVWIAADVVTIFLPFAPNGSFQSGLFFEKKVGVTIGEGEYHLGFH